MDSQKFPRNFSWILWVSSVKHWGQQPLQRGFCSYFFPDLVHSLAHVTGEVDSNNWKLTFEHRVLDSPLRLSELGRGFFTLGHGPGAWVKAQTCLDCVWSDRADSTHLFLLWALSFTLSILLLFLLILESTCQDQMRSQHSKQHVQLVQE